MRLSLLALALAVVLVLTPGLPRAEESHALPDSVSIFLVDQESRLRLLPGSTRFEESVLRQSNLTERAALRRYTSGHKKACLERAFDTLKSLCGAEPAPLELGDEEESATAGAGKKKTLELPPAFKRPEPPSAEDRAALRGDALPAPRPPSRSLQCPLSAFRGELGRSMSSRARDAGVESLYITLVLTTKLPPSRADKREYWRLHGTQRDFQNETETRAGAADTRSGREFDSPDRQNYEVAVNDFERSMPDFDNLPPILRVQLRGESPEGHVELLAGRLLAKLPRTEDEPFDAETLCKIDTNALLEMLKR